MVAVGSFAQLDSACAEVRDFTAMDGIALAPASQLDRIISNVNEGAILQVAIANAFTPNRTRDTNGCLGETACLDFRGSRAGRLAFAALKARWVIPLRVREREPAKIHLL